MNAGDQLPSWRDTPAKRSILAFAAAERLHEGGMPAPTDLLKLAHAGLSTDEFDAVCRRWLASARHPRFGRP